ncbi:GHKL domain protein [Bacteriovorax sp. BAL6_X]|uniref:hybrid sensor histidine kinase/response regulator n=1 Tax=Bacteriovorax sp. BAL6_X TaxID=1201290 RepID=UPI000386D67E|nr:hybrid sensor histidine kinase/response regulator [Bacteriovorax sp. BAL6_X]EPZ50065.1 GHKL domain protein [Bacteriovorax sp. BAL6_X]
MKLGLSKISLTILILGISFLSLLYYQREQFLREKYEEEFKSSAQEIISTIHANRGVRGEALVAISHFFASSLNVNQWEFNNFTKPTLKNLNISAICYSGENGTLYETLQSKGKTCGKFGKNNKVIFDTATSDIILQEFVSSVDGTKGRAYMIFSFSSLLPKKLKSDDNSNYRVNLDIGYGAGEKSYNFYRHEEPFATDGSTNYYLTVSGPRIQSTLTVSFDYIVNLALFLFIVVLTVYIIEAGRRREYLISKKVKRQERAIKKQYEELGRQKKLVSQNERLASIGILAAGIGHEINNPLTIILGHLKSLKKRIGEANSKELLEKVEKSEAAAQRIEKIVSGLRKFSRQAQDEEPRDFSVVNIFKDTVSMLKDFYDKDNIHLSLYMNVSEKALIKGERGKFQQVLINLISNARDAVEGKVDGKINIIVKESNERITFKVEDNGHGISEEDRSRVFDLFYTTKDIGKGTGMGLSIAHGFIKDEFNGKMAMKSVVGIGTVFKVSLPIHYGEELSSRQESKMLSLSDFKMKFRAIVVDDEEGIRDLLEEILQDIGITVSLAENGKIAYEMYVASPDSYDLIITDMKMPVMNGPKLIKSIRSNKLIKQPRILITTGCVNINLEGEDRQASSMVDGFLYKPFSEEDIVREISKAMGGGVEKKVA